MTAEPDPLLATVVGGRFRVLRLIGSGGMGDVYEAEHLVLARPVALKVLKPALAADDTVRERFLREPRLAAAIRHPNIVPILDAGEADGRPYIAMEYIEGATLRVLLDERGRLPPARAIVMLRDVAAALDAAHEDGLVHRDVKPANILIDRNDTVILTDFGVAKDMTSTQATTVGGSFFGTPDYAPPEQFEGGSVDARSDLYSLGCVAVECLTGAIPFDAHSGLQAFVAHVQEEPPSASERVPGLGKEIDAVIARALAKQPDERYESCGQFVEAASAALAVTSGTAAARSERPPGGRRWPSITRKRSIVLAATALIVALAAGVGGALVANGGSGDDPASAASAEPTQTAPEPAAAPPEPGPPVAITEPAPGPASAADAASPAAGPDETDRRVAPAPEPDPAPTPAPVDDAILATSFAGGLTLGDGPEQPFDEVIFDVDFDRRGNEHPAVVAFLEGSDDAVSIPFDVNYETPGDTLSLLTAEAFFLARAVAFEESDGGVLFASGLLTNDDTGDEVPFELRLGLHTGTSTFLLDENRAILNGDLGSAAFRQVRHLIDNHPEVDTIVLGSVPGSVDDAINVETGRLIRNAGYATVVATGGEVTSGGVDLFVAGAERTIEPGARVGVHSWCCAASGKGAGELPRDHPDHASLLGYLNEMLGDESGADFYFFTLEAAPPEGIHFVTAAEIGRFGLTTGE